MDKTTYRSKILPRNCVFVSETDTNISFLIEMLPGIQRFQYNNSNPDWYSGRRRTTYGENYDGEWNVATPWQYFLVIWTKTGNSYTINRIHLWWARDQVSSFASPVSIPKVPNVYSNGKICLGFSNLTMNCNHGRYDNIVKYTTEMVENYYGTIFNQELHVRFAFGSPKNWQKKTEKDPFCWMSLWYSQVPLRRRLQIAGVSV